MRSAAENRNSEINATDHKELPEPKDVIAVTV